MLALPWALPIGFTLDGFVSCAVVDRFTGGNSCQVSVVDHKVSHTNSPAAVTSFWLARCLGGQSWVSSAVLGWRLSQAPESQPGPSC